MLMWWSDCRNSKSNFQDSDTNYRTVSHNFQQHCGNYSVKISDRKSK